MKDWKIYSVKIDELRKILEETLGGLDVEYELKTPDEPDFDHHFKVPYLLLKYYTDQEHAHARKIELFGYYFDSPIQETANLIKDMVEEFLMEIDQSEYGGG